MSIDAKFSRIPFLGQHQTTGMEYRIEHIDFCRIPPKKNLIFLFAHTHAFHIFGSCVLICEWIRNKCIVCGVDALYL